MRIPVTVVLATLLAPPLAAHQSQLAGQRQDTAAGKVREDQRQQLVSEGNAALAAGQAAAAEDLFERAGNLAHEPDAEIGQVRAMMQAGAYRRALAFAAHTAGVHPEDPAGATLYAWLLYLGGQVKVADDTLARALVHHPGQIGLIAMRAGMSDHKAGTSFTPAGTSAALAPASPASRALPDGAQVVSSGVLVGAGAIALAPAGRLGHATRAWVRDGLGRLAAATIERGEDTAGVVRLRLAQPLPPVHPGADRDALPERNPFPGSPAFVVGYAALGASDTAWPLLRTGFLGMPVNPPGHYALGIPVTEGMLGGAVFDGTGMLIGVVAADGVVQSGDARIVLPALLRRHVGADAPATPLPRGRMPLDEIYERAMARVVQVLIER